jgi:SAM-dependent methyltransferase
MIFRRLGFSRLATDKSGALLDLGCGSGPFLRYFHSLGYARLFGLEPDPALIANIPPGLADVRKGVAEAVPFADASFDYVWVYGVLHHLPGPDSYRAACGEISRVLKPGGIVFILEPGRYWTFRAMEAAAKMLGAFSRTFRALRETMDEERPQQHDFLQNHGVVRDSLLERSLERLVDDYFFYTWLFVARKPRPA